MIKEFLLLMTLNLYFVKSIPITNSVLYVSQKEISNKKAFLYPLKIRNDLGFLKLDRVYFLHSKNYVCPEGLMIFAYKDQRGQFRVASSNLDEEPSTSTEISRALLIENCKKSISPPTKNYQKGTISSLAKKNKDSFKPATIRQEEQNARQDPNTRKHESNTREYESNTRHYESSSKQYKPNVIQQEPNSRHYESSSKQYEFNAKQHESNTRHYEPNAKQYQPNARQYESTSRQYDITDDLHSNDVTSIESEAASFPAYMFNDKGDIIYGSGIVVTIFTAVMGFIKMLRENRSLVRQLVTAKNSLSEFLEEKSPVNGTDMHVTSSSLNHQPKPASSASSCLNSTRQDNSMFTTAKINESKESFQNSNSNSQSTSHHNNGQQPLTVNFNMPSLVESRNINTIPSDQAQSINDRNDKLVISNQAEFEEDKEKRSEPCSCPKGNCISGRCKCFINKRACTSQCHRGKKNDSCRATSDYYVRLG